MVKMIKCKQYAKHHIADSHKKTTTMADSQFQASKPVLSIWQESVHKIDSQTILYIHLDYQVDTGLPKLNLSIPVKSIRLISSSAQISVFPNHVKPLKFMDMHALTFSRCRTWLSSISHKPRDQRTYI